MSNRRGFLLGLGAALAAPAIVKADSLMKIAMLRESLGNKTATALLMQAMESVTLREIWPDGFLQGIGYLVILGRNGEIVRRIVTEEEFYA